MLFATTSGLVAQQPRPATRASIDRWAATIDASVPRMQHVRRDIPGLSAEGGQAVLYSVGDTLQKVVVMYYGESGNASECYYLRDGHVQLFAQTQAHYTRPLSGRVRSSTFERVWLDADSIVFWRDSLGRTRHAAAARTAKAAEIRADLRTLLDSATAPESPGDRMPNVRCS